MVALEPGFHGRQSWRKSSLPGTKGPRRSLPLKCRNLARGESMKDPVSVLGCWRGFSLWLDGSTQGDSTYKRLKRLFYFFSRSSRPIFPLKTSQIESGHELRFGGGFTRSAAREQITGQRVIS